MMNTMTPPSSATTLNQFDKHLTLSRKTNQLKHLLNLIYGNTSEIVGDMGQEAHDAIVGIASDLATEIDATLNNAGVLHA